MKAVKQGKEVLLTERGKPLAVVSLIEARDDASATVRRLESTGLLRAASKRPVLPAWSPRSVRGAPFVPHDRYGERGTVTAHHWAYFDTSVLMKRYVKEAGSGATRRLLQRFGFLSSAIAPVEAMSTLSRRRASGDLAPQDFLAIRSRLHKDRAYWE
jgi:antitoxin (DNA-binding transcriptional repressor) of toxin-antitoxin stability system